MIVKLVLLTKGDFNMKKFISIILTFVFVLLCGCSSDTNNNSSDAKTVFKQEVTIVKLPSPPKCKTTDDVSVINEVVDVLSKIEKSPIDSENINGGWTIMIKLNIDGQSFNYTIGGVFTDSDGRQYIVSNHKEIEDKLTKIYNDLEVPEVDYP